MKTQTQRGYVHKKFGAVMLWHRSLQCWILNRIQKNGKVQQDLYAFKNSRAEYGVKAPQAGWQGIQVKHKGLEKWDELVRLAWAQKEKA